MPCVEDAAHKSIHSNRWVLLSAIHKDTALNSVSETLDVVHTLTWGVVAILLACCSDGLGFTRGEATGLWPFKCEGVAAGVNRR